MSVPDGNKFLMALNRQPATDPANVTPDGLMLDVLPLLANVRVTFPRASAPLPPTRRNRPPFRGPRA
ncbi:MAG TPA: hypothetical protein VML54_09295 [Candidatus Limnocylindrales bacterium]|nr:hypothetical protein [Candidatus Limnocylindrales bacterium]